jgi:hypothetical protein
MAERRSLGAALDLSPEKMAFIQGGPVPAKAAPVTQRIEPPKVEVAEETAEEERPQVERAAEPVRRSRGRRQSRAPLPQGDEFMLGIANLLVPLTTRLQPTTAATLKRAGLEQKLRGQSPGTVQEIVEEAIQNWLRDAGYLN